MLLSGWACNHKHSFKTTSRRLIDPRLIDCVPTVCRHVRCDVCPLRLQGHLVDTVQHPPCCVRAIELQLASLAHVGVNFQTDNVMQSSLEPRLAFGRHSDVLESVPAEQRLQRFGVSRTQNVILILLLIAADVWVAAWGPARRSPFLGGE